MRFAVVATALAVVGLLPVASALPLLATLQMQEPARLTGALLPAPGDEGALAFFHFDDNATAQNERLYESSRVRVIVHNWGKTDVDDHLPGALNRSLSYHNTSRELDDVRLDLTSLAKTGQVLLTHEPSIETPLRVEDGGCSVQDSAVRNETRFPEDPKSHSATTWLSIDQGPGRLAASCRTRNLTSLSPSHVWFYGMTVELYWTATEHETIRTGTFARDFGRDERQSQLYFGEVTQILELELLDKPATASIPVEGEARFYAPRFLGAGQLEVADSVGQIVWGSASQEGTIPAFAATGEFDMRWQPSQHVGFEGNTLDGPTVAPMSAPVPQPPAPSKSPLPAVAATAAAVGLLLAVWGFYARLSRDELLDHPRRRLIVEFVRNTPGVETNEMARALGLRAAKAFYHVRRLQLGGHVSVHRIGGRTALFVAPSVHETQTRRIALLRRATLKRIHGLLLERPGLAQAEMAGSLGLNQSQVSRGLSALAGAGLVEATIVDGRRQYSAKP